MTKLLLLRGQFVMIFKSEFSYSFAIIFGHEYFAFLIDPWSLLVISGLT